MEKAWEGELTRNKSTGQEVSMTCNLGGICLFLRHGVDHVIYILLNPPPPEECGFVGPLCVEVPAFWKAVEISEAKATQIASRGMDLAGYEPSVRTEAFWGIKCLLVLDKTNVSETSQERTSLKDGYGCIVGS